MAVPALIYLAIAGDVAPGGWGVPVATDIALYYYFTTQKVVSLLL